MAKAVLLLNIIIMGKAKRVGFDEIFVLVSMATITIAFVKDYLLWLYRLYLQSLL